MTASVMTTRDSPTIFKVRYVLTNAGNTNHRYGKVANEANIPENISVLLSTEDSPI